MLFYPGSFARVCKFLAWPVRTRASPVLVVAICTEAGFVLICTEAGFVLICTEAGFVLICTEAGFVLVVTTLHLGGLCSYLH